MDKIEENEYGISYKIKTIHDDEIHKTYPSKLTVYVRPKTDNRYKDIKYGFYKTEDEATDRLMVENI
jgi:hypothetical protein